MEKLVEFLFSISLAANALFFVPQILSLYKRKNPEGASLMMFACFNLLQVVSMMYGYIKRDYILVLGFGFSLLTCGAVTVLIVVYRMRVRKQKNAKV